MIPYSSVKVFGWVIPVSQVLGYWGNLGKLGQNTQNHMQGHKSNPKSLVHHLTSNEVLHCYTYLWVFKTSIRAIWGNRAQIPQIMWIDTWKVIKSSAQYFISNIYTFTLVPRPSKGWVILVIFAGNNLESSGSLQKRGT